MVVYQIITLDNLKLPSFTTSEDGNDSVTTVSAKGIDVESAIFQYKTHVSPIEGETERIWPYDKLKLKNVNIKGLNLVLPRKVKKQ